MPMRGYLIRGFLRLLPWAVAAAAPAAAAAQACLGLPAFTDASFRLNVAAEFPDSARAYAAGVGAGRPGGVFLNLGGGVVEYQGSDERAFLGFAELGVQRDLGPVQLCPVAGGYLAAGPDLEEYGISSTSRGASAGVAVGASLGLRTVDVIPSAAVKYELLSQKSEQEDVGATTETSYSGVIDLGVGLALLDRFTVQPLAHIPFASDEDQVTFGLFASVILPIRVPGGRMGR
jgi:hypothetical protein